MALGTPPLLCGRGARELKLAVDRLQGPKARSQILRMFSNFFAVIILFMFIHQLGLFQSNAKRHNKIGNCSIFKTLTENDYTEE